MKGACLHRAGILLSVIMGTILIAMAVAGFVVLARLSDRAANPQPSPSLSSIEDQERSSSVDWSYWRQLNPDVVGWILIPGTDVSQPVVQATASDPDYYLNHDATRAWNPYGAVFLDAECALEGLDSPNAVIYGHHMDDGSMFTELARYADPLWASQHPDVILLTPDGTRTYKVRYTRIVDNSANPKRTAFRNQEDFRNWYEQGMSNALAVLDETSRPMQAISLVTCSYHRFDDERTVAICSQATPERKEQT